jgi:HSP20 family protein
MIPTIWRTERPVSSARNYPVLTLFDEVNRLLEESLPAGTWSEGSRNLANFTPKIDIKETEREFILIGEFPGMQDKDIQIELKDNTVKLSGEKKFEHEQKEGERTYVERSYGSFSRTIPFNVEIDEDNTTATMKNGVLTLTVPKSAKVIKGAKKVSIKTS